MKHVMNTVSNIRTNYKVTLPYQKIVPGLKRQALLLGVTSCLVLSGCSTVTGAIKSSDTEKKASSFLRPLPNATTEVQSRNSFRRSVYASAGVGASRLTPENRGIETWGVTDRVNNGGQITIGADVNRHLSLELHSADLGSAGVEQLFGSQRGRINYHLHGGSVLWYAGKNRHNNKRRGFTGYARGGVARLQNSAVGNAPFSQRNSTQLLIGAGLEYTTRIGLGLRAEAISFDADVQYAQLGVLYRIGRKAESRPAIELAEKKEVKIVPIAPLAVAIDTSPKPLVVDGDNDGVNDSIDQCLSTKEKIVVDSVGCAVFDGVLDGVNFVSNSARLTTEAQQILNGAAEKLKQYPNAKVKVGAHTDNYGDERYNRSLSAKRAEQVVLYLGNRGVNPKSLFPRAYGETQPIADNGTAEGRARNRRVEFKAIQ